MSSQPSRAGTFWCEAIAALDDGGAVAEVLTCEESHLVVLLRLANQPEVTLSGRGVLSREEQDEAERLKVSDHADLHRLSRVAMRNLMAGCLGCAPAAVPLQRDPGKRPRVVGAKERLGLAHTHGLVVVGLARNADIGVDVERVERPVRMAHLLQRVCTAQERTWVLTGDTADARKERFLHLWVRKEAWLKALGVGLAGGLRESPGLPPDVPGADPAVAPRIESRLLGDAWVAWTLRAIEPS